MTMMLIKNYSLLIIFLFVFPSISLGCDVSAYFSPQDNIEQIILSAMDKAKETVHLSLFGISNRRLADKLVDLKTGGINIVLCIDKKQAALKSDLHAYLKKNGIVVVVKKTGVLEHNKFAIIDSRVVVMGSWNWSASAQAQDNSDVIIKNCPDVVGVFEAAFQRIYKRDER